MFGDEDRDACCGVEGRPPDGGSCRVLAAETGASSSSVTRYISGASAYFNEEQSLQAYQTLRDTVTALTVTAPVLYNCLARKPDLQQVLSVR